MMISYIFGQGVEVDSTKEMKMTNKIFLERWNNNINRIMGKYWNIG